MDYCTTQVLYHNIIINKICCNVPGRPTFEISAPFLSSSEKNKLTRSLRSLSEAEPENPVLFQCIEEVRTFLSDYQDEMNNSLANDSICDDDKDTIAVETLPDVKCPEIITGECLEDRKSVFQGESCSMFRSIKRYSTRLQN